MKCKSNGYIIKTPLLHHSIHPIINFQINQFSNFLIVSLPNRPIEQIMNLCADIHIGQLGIIGIGVNTV